MKKMKKSGDAPRYEAVIYFCIGKNEKPVPRDLSRKVKSLEKYLKAEGEVILGTFMDTFHDGHAPGEHLEYKAREAERDLLPLLRRDIAACQIHPNSKVRKIYPQFCEAIALLRKSKANKMIVVPEEERFLAHIKIYRRPIMEAVRDMGWCFYTDENKERNIASFECLSIANGTKPPVRVTDPHNNRNLCWKPTIKQEDEYYRFKCGNFNPLDDLFVVEAALGFSLESGSEINAIAFHVRNYIAERLNKSQSKPFTPPRRPPSNKSLQYCIKKLLPIIDKRKWREEIREYLEKQDFAPPAAKQVKNNKKRGPGRKRMYTPKQVGRVYAAYDEYSSQRDAAEGLKENDTEFPDMTRDKFRGIMNSYNRNGTPKKNEGKIRLLISTQFPPTP